MTSAARGSGPGRPAGAPQLTERFARAFDEARILHAAEVRKGTEIPYVSHPMAVSSIVLEHGGTEVEAIAALLHDTAEDAGGVRRLAALRAEFGDQVADIVEALSDDLPSSRQDKRPWWDRKVAYLEHLQDVPVGVALVSAADKLHNVSATRGDHRRIGAEVWRRFKPEAGRSGSLWYFRRLATVLGGRLDDAGGRAADLGAELRRQVERLLDEVAASGSEDVTRSTLDTEFESMCAKEDAIRTTLGLPPRSAPTSDGRP